MTEKHESRLREALDDLWATIAKPEIDQLDEKTIATATDNHELLWHLVKCCSCLNLNDVAEDELSIDPLCPVHG